MSQRGTSQYLTSPNNMESDPQHQPQEFNLYWCDKWQLHSLHLWGHENSVLKFLWTSNSMKDMEETDLYTSK